MYVNDSLHFKHSGCVLCERQTRMRSQICVLKVGVYIGLYRRTMLHHVKKKVGLFETAQVLNAISYFIAFGLRLKSCFTLYNTRCRLFELNFKNTFCFCVNQLKKKCLKVFTYSAFVLLSFHRHLKYL